ncbi:MAG: phenylalanine--tRNA ligase subunit beta [Lachnospiraceae bacterium]|nr:phenylalanine--tRNA ligase subunit beta [Lachnospiraceae bacterium]
MLVPLSWLKEYVDIEDIAPSVLEEKLFSCGFEVEEVIEIGKDISGVVVGLVKECEPIPDTHLHVCKVDVGQPELLQICCGADNVCTGKKFPVALDGASVLATAKDHKTVEGVMTIKKGKLRGYDSEGMLCSGVEIGVAEGMYPGASYNGLLVLDDSCEIGADVKPIVGIDDYIFDVSITANRPDCQCITGIAREVAAVLNREYKAPSLEYHEDSVTKDGFGVEVIAPDICPRYIGHYVHDVVIKESPLWMQRRLALVGQMPISNMVDITNYVSLEMGQPMHAFDCDYIEGNKIVVRRAEDKEKIVTLDEQEYELTNNNLVICDGVKPVAIAGVMGGLNSEIRDTTKEVLFESAKFARDNIRKTSRALGKRTDASAKYEKGVDEYSTYNAMKRALHLVEELECGKVSCTHVDVNTGNSIEPKEMKVSIAKVNRVLGIEVPTDDIIRILKNLSFDPKVNGDELTLMIPAYREDMESYPDVAEEVIRMYGYDHIVDTFLPDAQVTMGGLSIKQKKELKLKKDLCAQGAYECIHYSFISPSDFNLLNLSEDADERKAIKILNPINEDLSVMRTTLAPSMLHAVSRNQKKGNLEGKLYEVASRFIPKNLPLTEYPEEKQTLCIAIFGEKYDFYSLKSIVNSVADTFFTTFRFDAVEKSFLHPYQTASIKEGDNVIGYLGKVSYEVAEKLDLRTDAYICEIDLDYLYKLDTKASYKPLSKFAPVNRDLALLMDKDITCGAVEDVIKEACKYISAVKLFDVYEGENIPADKKSLAFTITFTPGEEDFEADSVDKYVKKVLGNLKYKLNVEIRS